jgi:chromate transporter
VLLVGVLFANPAVQQYSSPALRGAAPVVAGMVLATGLKMSRPYRRLPRAWLIGGVTFVAVAIFQVPLLLVLLVIAPLSIVLSWRSPA